MLDKDNAFTVILDCQEGNNIILIEAINPDGEETQLTREFICQPE
jgi:hypothetical protein